MQCIALQKCQLYVAEAAALMGCSSMKVYGLIRSGKLPAHKEGKAWKYALLIWRRIWIVSRRRTNKRYRCVFRSLLQG